MDPTPESAAGKAPEHRPAVASAPGADAIRDGGFGLDRRAADVTTTKDTAAATPDSSAAPAPHGVVLPDWLARLATESYQAELLISGFAIVGSWNLIGLIDPAVEWAIFELRADLLSFVRWVLYYLSLGVLALPALFVAHFALRTYWVGLVGLSSVYPHGFGRNFGTVPEWVAEDVARRSPSLAAQIERIDRHSSVMFAIAALTAMVFTSIAALLGTVLSLGVGLERLTGGTVGFRDVFYVSAGLLAVLYVVNLAMLLLKRYHDRARFRKTYLLIYRGFSRVVYTVFTQPASFLSTLLTTNSSGRAAAGPIVVGLVVLVIAVVQLLGRTYSHYLVEPGAVVHDALREDRYFPARYWDEWDATQATTILPSVPTERVPASLSTLPVLLPLTGEEEHRIDTRYPAVEPPDSLDRAARRDWRRADFLRRAARQFRVRLGERVVRTREIQGMTPAGQRFGLRFMVDLPTPLPLGRQHLYLDRRASVDPADTSWAPRAVVPLWVTGATHESLDR